MEENKGSFYDFYSKDKKESETPGPEKDFWHKINPAIVLSLALAFVAAYFGLNEVLSPQNWVAFVPIFLASGKLATGLVMAHGLLLIAIAAALVLNFHRKIAASLFALMLLEIIINLIGQTNLSDIAVRDIGLLGAALSLVFL